MNDLMRTIRSIGSAYSGRALCPIPEYKVESIGKEYECDGRSFYLLGECGYTHVEGEIIQESVHPNVEVCEFDEEGNEIADFMLEGDNAIDFIDRGQWVDWLGNG